MTVTSSSANVTSAGLEDPTFSSGADEDLPGRTSAVLIGLVGLVGVVAFGSIVGIPDLEHHLQSDIERHALRDVTGVDVIVHGRTAVLAGTVRSADERRAVIDRAARRWGVAQVDARGLAVQVPVPNPKKPASATSARRPNTAAVGTADRSHSVGAPTSMAPATTTIVFDVAAIRRLKTELESIRLAAPIVFARSSPTLLSSGRITLDRIAAALSRTPVAIRIEAHTDASGDPQGNVILSTLRAEAVRNELIARGVSPAIVTAVGRGQSGPIASNASAAGRARNRRVEFIVVSSAAGPNP